jgi:5-methylcytosine-specific restriction endonuclease McrA
VLYIRREEGASILLSQEGVEKLSAKTKAIFARLGLCGQCRAPFELGTLRCRKSVELGEAHEGVWISSSDWKEVEPFVAIEDNREDNRGRGQRRADAMRNVPGFHTKEDIASILEAQYGECYYCGKTLTRTETRRDHMTPVADEGGEWPSNIALTCIECNHTKSNRGATAFWNHLRKKHGAAWIIKRTKACEGAIKLKKSLTILRKAELAEFCKDLQRKLNKGIDQLRAAGTLLKPEFAEIYVQQSKDGIRIELENTAIEFPSSSHRRVKQWATKQWPQILNSIMVLESGMGTMVLRESKATTKKPQDA